VEVAIDLLQAPFMANFQVNQPPTGARFRAVESAIASGALRLYPSIGRLQRFQLAPQQGGPVLNQPECVVGITLSWDRG
jgi:hypothetical protein